MELWGGVECTINRIGDVWRDQCELTGHANRLCDIDLIADLGVSAVRYPTLWERISPDRPDQLDWSWVGPRLERLRQRGVKVIAGLIHHGSGPRYTNLLHPSFATGLARHARAVAERYPWIEDWTPVNEPVTTARFSALYGLWYPHLRDEGAFWRALLNQIDGVRLSMREIRTVNPAARLIQTDDLGRTYATAPLRQQAAFDNLRRWAGWDLLRGDVTSSHPVFDRIAAYGLEDRLRAIADNPCPPDIIGINHYLTSDRFLEHRTRRYPHLAVGGNGRERYVDIEAVRVLEPAPQGLEGALREAWSRYRTPLAVTEVHNGCTRDEQMRWTARAWDLAKMLNIEGIDVRAITGWALFGSQGWNTLLTGSGVYEAGTFDVRGERPRPTAMSSLLRGLASQQPRAEACEGLGWWERPVRLLHSAVHRSAPLALRPAGKEQQAASPILICGATGVLGQALARACRHRGLAYRLTGRENLALEDPSSIARALERFRPWAVINAAGWARVDDAERDEAGCFAANTIGAANLARECGARGLSTVSFSSDLVFDGRAGRAYCEDDTPRPLNAYGRSKATMEDRIAKLAGRHLIVRTAAFFGPHDRNNFAWAVKESLGRGKAFRAARDHIVTPTYTPHLADAVLDLAIDGESGTWHLTNYAAMSRSDFARVIAEAHGLDASLIEPVCSGDMNLVAARPANAALVSRRGAILPSFDQAIGRFIKDSAIANPLALAAA